MNKLLILFMLFCLSGSVLMGQNNTSGSTSDAKNQISLTFKELPNSIQLIGDAVKLSKFSNSLKIQAHGITQYDNKNIAFTLNLILPDFDFTDGKKKQYTNDDHHFFDARRDAALTLIIGSIQFGTIYRSKEKENILSKVATTNYKITSENLKDKKGHYRINIEIAAGTILQESSETKSKKEETVLSTASENGSTIQVQNPQPALPKVIPYKFKSSSEVWGKSK